ncbi:RNA-directed DNA polymerase, eukaryota, reverse transcriptase zinc-binding domain protein [Tanacetum coccineum]
MSDFAPGRAVTDAAQRKRGKYMTKCADIGYGFLPFSFSSFGELEKDAVTLLKRVRNFSMAQDIGARAASHIFNRIGFSIAKGVGAQIVSRLPSNGWYRSGGLIRAWDETVNKLKMSLSSWKLKTLSIGGRLTLLKSVLGSTPIYNMSLFKVPKAVLKSMESIRRNFFNGIRDGEKKIAWVSWSKVLASKSNGGLGVSSFYALNRGLLFKWIWRFLSRDQSLWAQVIHALHGSNTSTLSASYSSLWSSIIKECNALKSQGLDLISHCKIRVGNGMSTSFWHDQWLGDSCLRLSYPRLFALENNKVCSVAAKMSAPFVSSLRRDVRGGEESAQLSRISDLLDTVVLSNMGDRRFWDLNGDGCFRVKDVRRLLDDMLLPKSDVPSRWVKQIPIKVNVLAWKISMDRLPTRVNLHRRGVQVSPISCPICCEALENLDHLLFCCDLAKDIARFNQVQNKCWKECFTLPGGVSGHIETISSSLIQIFEKMVFLKT